MGGTPCMSADATTETRGTALSTARVVPVEHLACGCIVVLDTRVVVFARDDCPTHEAGRAVPDDPQFAEWVDHGEAGA